MRIAHAVLISLAALISCGPTSNHHGSIRCRPTYSYMTHDLTTYDVYPTQLTPKGISVDTSGLNINLSKIDRLTDEVEACLYAQFGDPPIMPPDVVKDGMCEQSRFSLPIRRTCLTVKVASNWFLSKYEYAGSLQQLLPYTNGGSCTDKGLPPGVCYYRAAYQDELTIVVPPSFLLYKDPLVKIVTGCFNPWYANKLAVCMSPTTNPLDDGSQP